MLGGRGGVMLGIGLWAWTEKDMLLYPVVTGRRYAWYWTVGVDREGHVVVSCSYWEVLCLVLDCGRGQRRTCMLYPVVTGRCYAGYWTVGVDREGHVVVSCSYWEELCLVLVCGRGQRRTCC